MLIRNALQMHLEVLPCCTANEYSQHMFSWRDKEKIYVDCLLIYIWRVDRKTVASQMIVFPNT